MTAAPATLLHSSRDRGVLAAVRRSPGSWSEIQGVYVEATGRALSPTATIGALVRLRTAGLVRCVPRVRMPPAYEAMP